MEQSTMFTEALIELKALYDPENIKVEISRLRHRLETQRTYASKTGSDPYIYYDRCECGMIIHIDNCFICGCGDTVCKDCAKNTEGIDYTDGVATCKFCDDEFQFE
jgi:hypothetical protein